MGKLGTKVLLCTSCGSIATIPPMNGTKYVCTRCSGDLVATDILYSMIVFEHIIATHGMQISYFIE
jgi:uncharacterized paraquat-inducible protein A